MGDHVMKKTSTVTKPRVELEELYQGIPDDSVNLTFQDLADLSASEKGTKSPMVKPTINDHSSSPNLPRKPSLDFNTGLQASSHHGYVDVSGGDTSWGPYGNFARHAGGGGRLSPRCKASGDGRHSTASIGYDDVSGMSTASARGGGGRRRRPGIPHSKICTICSTYTYIFRTRCLVCGRVYCRQCVEVGMGDMMEGRKCIECLGLRFSQRYIERAGKVGCCSWRYPSTLKQTELKWAEKGTRRSGDKGYNGHHGGMPSSTSRSPISVHDPSFVMSSSYSPYSTPHHHPFPL